MIAVCSNPRSSSVRADRGDAAIHHVRRRDDVCAGHGVRERRLCQVHHGDVVDDVLSLDDAAMAMRRVLAQADVGDDDQVLDLAFERANRVLDRSVGVRRSRARCILVGRQAEQQDGGNAVGLRCGRFLDRLIHRELKDPGHRRHLASHALSPRRRTAGR